MTLVTQGIGLHRKSERWGIGHMSELDDLISKFYLGQDKPDSESVSKLIREFGVSPGDTERIHSMLNDLGYTDAQLGDINEMAKVAQGFLDSMPDETRNQIMDFAFQAISNLELGKSHLKSTGYLRLIMMLPGTPADLRMKHDIRFPGSPGHVYGEMTMLWLLLRGQSIVPEIIRITYPPL